MLETHRINLLKMSGDLSDEKRIHQTVSVGRRGRRNGTADRHFLSGMGSEQWFCPDKCGKNGYRCSHESPGTHFRRAVYLDPNKEERLSEMKKLDSWKRGEYVQKQGWATMPGEKQADIGIADECARRLAEIKL